MKIGDRLLDRLVKEVEARAFAESNLKVALERATAAEAKAITCVDESNRMTAAMASLQQRYNKMSTYQIESEPKLRRLHAAADAFDTEITRHPRGSNARAARASELRKALQEAYNYCDPIPF